MEELENKLLQAATEGSVASLHELLREDSLILERDVANCFSETPLHIAAMLGHTNFVSELIRIKPQLTTDLNSTQSSPLHLASPKGHVDVVRALLSANRESCLARDRNGLTPLHLAALKGRVEVMKALLHQTPDAAELTVHRGENILHLCVKYYQLEALKLLLNHVHSRELINTKDADGNTLLHIAVAYKQVEAIKFLLAMPGLDVNARNQDGMTAMDILMQSRRDTRDIEIQESFKHVGVFKVVTMDQNMVNGFPSSFPNHHTISPSIERNNGKHQEGWLEQKRSALMIVASLIATIAFQVGVNPPGGIWQDDSPQDNFTSSPHQAGFAIMSRNYPRGYTTFYIINTVSFISSLSIILLLVSGLPIRRRFFVWILMVITWVAITATALTYTVIIIMLTPDVENKSVLYVIGFTIIVWLLLMALLLIGHTIRVIVKLVRKLLKMVRRRRVARSTIIAI